MNKLYWIVCDDKDHNVFEGRYQGRTRGEALKFLKQTLGRKTPYSNAAIRAAPEARH
jgi:hypothetical protein